MDPSYNNSGQNATGNSGIPGAKPGVIASGPDTPSAEVPVLDVGADAQNPNGIFAGLSRRPTGGRPLGSRMDSGPITTQPIDKVTPSGGQRQSRRGLLIAGMALIGLALIAGVVALIMMTRGNKNETPNANAINMPSFNSLINYVSSGVESDTKINKEYDASDKYYLSAVTGDEKKEAYERTGDLMKKFVADYEANYGEEQENINQERIAVLIKSTNELFDFINVINFREKISGHEISVMNEKDGAAVAKTQAMAYYDFSKIKENSYVTDFMDSYETWVDALLNNSSIVNAAYSYVMRYYDMTDDFVASVYAINDLLNDDSMTGGEDE
ncbi:hypothetical protein IJG27_01605 [Candidatus Saccharibacteria bacterium]|nr:hypothetical protein [Candidatus Saccharibacteria bacterium]